MDITHFVLVPALVLRKEEDNIEVFINSCVTLSKSLCANRVVYVLCVQNYRFIVQENNYL